MNETISCPRCGKTLRFTGAELPRHCICPACGKSFGPAVDDLEPAEGTYDARVPAKKPRHTSGRFCEVCDAELRPDATFCDLCTSPVAEEDHPETEERRERKRRKKKRTKDDIHHLRMDLVALQIGAFLLVILCMGCSLPQWGMGMALLSPVFMLFYLMWHERHKPDEEDVDEYDRWVRERTILIRYCLINAAISLGLILVGLLLIFI